MYNIYVLFTFVYEPVCISFRTLTASAVQPTNDLLHGCVIHLSCNLLGWDNVQRTFSAQVVSCCSATFFQSYVKSALRIDFIQTHFLLPLYKYHPKLRPYSAIQVWLLFRPPGSASAGRGGLYILLLYFFDNRPYSSESAQQAPADTIPTVVSPAELIKYPQTFDKSLQGAKRPTFWPKFRPQSSSNRRIFELERFIGKQKQTCQGPMIGLPSYQSWNGWVPQLPEPLAHLVPQRVKVENF